jgi:arylsulfatase A-like enzyme
MTYKKYNRREFLRTVGTGLATFSALTFFSTCKERRRRPNILFIMADDHAERAISCYGHSLIETPQIDRIGKEGMRFNNSFVTNSICAPSRAVLLTGKYSHINGLRDNRDTFDGSQMTFPKLLQQAGYYTAVVGKWHLKTEPTGFDTWNILPGQGAYYNPILIENGKEVRHTGYVTEVITDLVIECLKNRARDKPFCVLYHHKAPHRNWMPDLKHLDLFKDKEIPLPKTFYDDYNTRSAAAKEQDMEIKNMFLSLDLKLHPFAYKKDDNSGGSKGHDAEKDWLNIYNSLTDEQRKAWDAHYEPINRAFKEASLEGEELAEWKYQRYMKDYLSCIASIDENVGRVLDFLDGAGLAKNTIVVYTSDQGFYLGEHGWYDKRFIYEESLSMPLLVRYPEEVPAGTLNDEMVLNLDFAPTFLDYAGVEIPSDIQGRSVRPLLKGQKVGDWRKSMYYHYYEYPHGWHDVKRHYGIRTHRYKLIHFYDDIDAWELYDLQLDPDELLNLYDSEDHQGIVVDLKKELRVLRQEYKVTD